MIAFLARFLPSPIVLVLVVVLVLDLLVWGVRSEKTVNEARQPGAQACTEDTHLFAFADVRRDPNSRPTFRSLSST